MPGLPDAVTREAYSHEVSSADRLAPSGGLFDTTLSEFILPYEAVRTAPSPDDALLDFLSATYAAAADTGGWARAALECPPGTPARPRPL